MFVLDESLRLHNRRVFKRPGPMSLRSDFCLNNLFEWSFSEQVTVDGEEYLKGIVLPGLRWKSSVTVEVRTVKARIIVQDCGTVFR